MSQTYTSTTSSPRWILTSSYGGCITILQCDSTRETIVVCSVGDTVLTAYAAAMPMLTLRTYLKSGYRMTKSPDVHFLQVYDTSLFVVEADLWSGEYRVVDADDARDVTLVTVDLGEALACAESVTKVGDLSPAAQDILLHGDWA